MGDMGPVAISYVPVVASRWLMRDAMETGRSMVGNEFSLEAHQDGRVVGGGLFVDLVR